MDGKTPQARATSSLRVCKCGCRAEFRPKRVDQKFATPNCKTRYTMAAYEAGLKVIESKGGMHHRKASNHQMQKLFACLSDGKPWTTRQLHEATKMENVSTAISELRRAGVPVSRAKFIRRTESGAKIFEYQLKP